MDRYSRLICRFQIRRLLVEHGIKLGNEAEMVFGSPRARLKRKRGEGDGNGTGDHEDEEEEEEEEDKGGEKGGETRRQSWR